MRRTLLYALLALAVPALAEPDPTPAQISVYVPTPDGVRLGVDVVFAGSATRRAPSLVQVTRYGRAGRDPGMLAHYGQAGLHQVFVDARGSGASFGTRAIEFSSDEVADLGQIVEWIARQPWSDGNVIFTGNSYAGDTAELATASGRNSLRAAVIRHSEFDPYRHLTYPGGVRNEMLITLWGAAVGEEDRGEACLQSVAACRALEHLEPVTGDADYTLLRQALAQHQLNFRADRDLAAVQFIDDNVPAGQTLYSVGARSRSQAIEAAGVPVQVWASWMDAGTAASALERYQSLPTVPAEVFIAAWAHGGKQSVDPFFALDQPNVMERARQLQAHTKFIASALAGKRAPRVVRYVPLGSTQWRDTDQWPPAGVAPKRWFLSAGHRLTDDHPAEAAAVDQYAVDFSATSGTANRWRTQLGGDPVVYASRAADDARLITYTSPVVDSDVELAGRVRVKLHIALDRSDAAVFAYLEDVSPEGKVTYLTEGQLRLMHRRPGNNVDREPSYRRADAQPVIPNSDIEAEILLQPVAARIRTGHRLRLALGGADAGTFARYPAEGALTFRIQRSAQLASWIEIPLRPWRDRT